MMKYNCIFLLKATLWDFKSYIAFELKLWWHVTRPTFTQVNKFKILVPYMSTSSLTFIFQLHRLVVAILHFYNTMFV